MWIIDIWPLDVYLINTTFAGLWWIWSSRTKTKKDELSERHKETAHDVRENTCQGVWNWMHMLESRSEHTGLHPQ